MARSKDLKTPLATISFAHDLFTIREGQSGYGCTLLFPKSTDLTALHNAALEAAKEEWGDKAAQWIKDEIIKSPFLDGDGKQGLNKTTGERHAGYAGTTFIRTRSGADFKPRVVNQQVNPIVTKDEIPSGSQVYAVVNAFTWENKENGKGISFGVSLVQLVKKAEGDEILGGSGGPAPESFFEVIESEEAPEVTKGGAGAGGLFG